MAFFFSKAKTGESRNGKDETTTGTAGCILGNISALGSRSYFFWTKLTELLAFVMIAKVVVSLGKRYT